MVEESDHFHQALPLAYRDFYNRCDRRGYSDIALGLRPSKYELHSRGARINCDPKTRVIVCLCILITEMKIIIFNNSISNTVRKCVRAKHKE